MLSVSVDSIYAHKVWQEVELSKMVEGGIPYPMLSDSGGKIGSLYGVYDEGGGGEKEDKYLNYSFGKFPTFGLCGSNKQGNEFLDVSSLFGAYW